LIGENDSDDKGKANPSLPSMGTPLPPNQIQLQK
jgi:hypothetical protein